LTATAAFDTIPPVKAVQEIQDDAPESGRDGAASGREASHDGAASGPKPRSPAEPQPPPESEPASPAAAPDPRLDRSRDLSRLTRHSYLAGLAGTVTVLGMGYLAARRQMMTRGWGIGGGDFDVNRSMVFVLLVCAAVMFAIELCIRLDVDRGRIIKVAPEVKRGEFAPFVARCLLVWGIDLGLFSLAIAFYQTANEYGFGHGGAQGYYRPWFAVMETFRQIYLWGGLPYVLLTRALQHDPRADRKQAAFVVIKAARRLYARFERRGEEGAAVEPPGHTQPPYREAATRSGEEGEPADPLAFDRYDKSAVLGLFVKIFFVPIMTVFFVDQFSHLIKNYEYLSGPNLHATIHDVHNVSYTIVFAVDVGLAWCGYVVSSRWIKNTLFSVEPTTLGWLVALLSYPPFNRTFGFYFSTPNENGFFSIASPTAVFVFAICSILSFTVYTSATVCFGLRFSNLTHRGIIQRGPYALVRHPAYAAKNFSWWCVMLPYAIWEMWTQSSAAPLLQVVGLVMMSGIYFWRAITEERHLSRDAEYRLYMKKVPYRFIPGVF
jgi:protein-S-isoprenylcysteine O-methyltransferase Ste14